MPRISYVNGAFQPHREAGVHIEDRGFQFGDGAYEVMTMRHGVIMDLALHYARMQRSLAELFISIPLTQAAFTTIIHELKRRNACTNGLLYIQITRGSARRNHSFPKHAMPSVVMTLRPMTFPTDLNKGVAVVTHPEIRWSYRHIKSVALLGNVLAKHHADRKNAIESILFDPDTDIVTEGSASNIFIVDAKGTLITHPANQHILAGISRHVLLDCARKKKIAVAERPFTRKELFAAKEAFLMSTTKDVCPVISVDGKKIGTGKPGALTAKLSALYAEYMNDYIEMNAA